METTLKYLTTTEKSELFEVINQDSSIHAIRNRAIFNIAKYCALRVSEINMIEISDYDPLLSHIYCKREKGSSNNTIRIVDSYVKNSMDLYLEQRKSIFPDSKYLFMSQKGFPISRKTLDYTIKEYCKKTSIPSDKRHFHVLKHTRAIELGNEGLDLKEIQWWLGHKNIDNTQIYMQFTTYQQETLYAKLMKRSTENGY